MSKYFRQVKTLGDFHSRADDVEGNGPRVGQVEGRIETKGATAE